LGLYAAAGLRRADVPLRESPPHSLGSRIMPRGTRSYIKYWTNAGDLRWSNFLGLVGDGMVRGPGGVDREGGGGFGVEEDAGGGGDAVLFHWDVLQIA